MTGLVVVNGQLHSGKPAVAVVVIIAKIMMSNLEDLAKMNFGDIL